MSCNCHHVRKTSNTQLFLFKYKILTLFVYFFFYCRGKFGTVRRAAHKETGVQYAAKFLRRRRRDQCYTKDINHEIAVLMLCADSKHIINLYAVHETRLETALVLELWVYIFMTFFKSTFAIKLKNTKTLNTKCTRVPIIVLKGSWPECFF